jgi:hypothetical protein
VDAARASVLGIVMINATFDFSEINAVTVECTAGSAAAPHALKAWTPLAIGEMFANREASAERPAVAHGFADRLLDPFRVWGV